MGSPNYISASRVAFLVLLWHVSTARCPDRLVGQPAALYTLTLLLVVVVVVHGVEQHWADRKCVGVRTGKEAIGQAGGWTSRLTRWGLEKMIPDSGVCGTSSSSDGHNASPEVFLKSSINSCKEGELSGYAVRKLRKKANEQ